MGDAPVPVKLPGDDVAVYVSIGRFPVYEGAVYVTVAVVALAPVAVPIVGALDRLPALSTVPDIIKLTRLLHTKHLYLF